MSTQQSRNEAEHQALQDLLPWYASGSLPESEAALVQEHLRSCGACREDLAWQRKLLETEGPLPAGLDAERALARLMPLLDAPSTPAVQATSQAPHAPAAARRGLGDRLRGWLAISGSWQFAAIAAQSLVIAMLAWPNAEPPAAYQALGRGPAGTPDLLVVFKPDAQVRDVQRLLQSAGARIVGGPTVTGAYMLDVEAGRQAALLSALRADPAVDLAESLAPGSPP